MNGKEQQDLRSQLARLPEQIRQYYNTYFSELRKSLERPDLFHKAVPDFLKGYKRVVSIGGKDGLIVVHFPIEVKITISQTGTEKILIRFDSGLDATEDIFEFITFPGSPVNDLISFVSDGEDISDVLPTETEWGTGVAGIFDKPAPKADLDTGQIVWKASWTRLAFCDLNYLYFWDDAERAKLEARKDIEPYIRGLEHKVLDEVAAPEDIEEAGIKAGDRGVVIEAFEQPSPALLVEYADPIGQTRALATYSSDLENLLDVFVDTNFFEHSEQPQDSNESTREQTHDFSSRSPEIRKGLVLA